MIQYQYDTNPRKIEYVETQKPQKKKNKTKAKKISKQKKVTKAKIKLMQRRRMFFAMAIVLTMLFIIIYRNSMINQSFSELQGLKKQATALKKENDQLEVNIQNSINLNNVETAAKEQLGMQKLTSAQTIYVNLPKEDYVEASSEAIIIDEETDWLSKIKSIF